MKLTKELVFLVKNSGGTIKELAAKLAVSESTVRRARRSRRFATVESLGESLPAVERPLIAEQKSVNLSVL